MKITLRVSKVGGYKLTRLFGYFRDPFFSPQPCFKRQKNLKKKKNYMGKKFYGLRDWFSSPGRGTFFFPGIFNPLKRSHFDSGPVTFSLTSFPVFSFAFYVLLRSFNMTYFVALFYFLIYLSESTNSFCVPWLYDFHIQNVFTKKFKPSHFIWKKYFS